MEMKGSCSWGRGGFLHTFGDSCFFVAAAAGLSCHRADLERGARSTSRRLAATPLGRGWNRASSLETRVTCACLIVQEMSQESILHFINTYTRVRRTCSGSYVFAAAGPSCKPKLSEEARCKRVRGTGTPSRVPGCAGVGPAGPTPAQPTPAHAGRRAPLGRGRSGGR